MQTNCYGTLRMFWLLLTFTPGMWLREHERKDLTQNYSALRLQWGRSAFADSLLV